MTCPKCRREMQEILSDGVPIDFCTGCRGTFLDKGEESGFSGFPEALAKALENGVRDPKPSDFACPRCAGRMREGWVLAHDFVLDRCDACGGLWFDSRELSRLRKLQPEKEVPPVPVAPVRPSQSDDTPREGTSVSGTRCPSCKQPPRATDLWQCRCSFQWHAIGTAGVCPKCRRRWEELQCLRCAVWSPPAKWMRP